jgi:hypothetical protein
MQSPGRKKFTPARERHDVEAAAFEDAGWRSAKHGLAVQHGKEWPGLFHRAENDRTVMRWVLHVGDIRWEGGKWLVARGK